MNISATKPTNLVPDWYGYDYSFDILSALNLWTTHPLSSGLPLFLIPELRAVSGNLRQPEVKCFAYK